MTPRLTDHAWGKLCERMFRCTRGTAEAFVLRPKYKRAIRMGCTRIVNYREGFTLIIQRGEVVTVLNEALRSGAPCRASKQRRRRAR
jgi:hypothetical protein